jgi:ribosomal protein L32
MVPISWGLLMFDEPYRSDELRQFPHAREWVWGGCEVDPKLEHAKRPHYVCPECKRAEREWALKHPQSEETKWILSPPNV